MQFTKGNILDANAEALINTVNTKGIMGKGIALQFKNKFPENFKLYEKACKKDEVRVGQVFLTKTNLEKPKYIINFPTKNHWRHPSKIQYIQEGLEDLKKVIQENQIKSIAIPPLGCGAGGLDWTEVKPLIEAFAVSLDNVEVLIFEPTNQFKSFEAKKSKTDIKLTKINAVLLQALSYYTVLGYELTVLEAQKIAYFIQRLGENGLKLRFEKHIYGPYSENLDFVLEKLNSGSYISGFDRNTVKPLTELKIEFNKFQEVENIAKNEFDSKQEKRLSNLSHLIEGFESPLGMELLSTVDYVIKQGASSLSDVIKGVTSWNSRKAKLMKEEYIEIAYKRLMEHADLLYQPTQMKLS